MRQACLILGCVTLLLGQTPPAAPVTKAPGDKVTLTIMADSQPKRAPVALQWEVVFPAQLMEIDGDPVRGGAAVKSDKSLQCKARARYALACTLSGGQNPIPDGTIAVFYFKILATAKPGPATFKIGRAAATGADSKVSSLDDTETAVVIR
jgi:hypothetical protein